MQTIIYKCPQCHEVNAEILEPKHDIMRKRTVKIPFQCDNCLTFLELTITLDFMKTKF